MASEQDDYMSDIFIAEEKEQEKKKTGKRKCVEKRVKPKSKVPKVSKEAVAREEGLQTPIADSNVGYQMLCKMGYEPGTSLGKSGTGRINPVSVETKQDRLGVGREVYVKAKEETERKLKESRENVFHENQRLIHTARLTRIDLAKCQSACEHLDTSNDILEPQCSWYWKSTDGISTEDGDSADEFTEVIVSEDEKLSILVDYLRSNYYYCQWCGQSYDNKEEMEGACPGDTRLDHDSL